MSESATVNGQLVVLARIREVITICCARRARNDGEPFVYKLWFSDTYVRTPAGWRYVFGQASTRLTP